MNRDSLIAGSILIGSAIIGAGLYFGLRSRPIVTQDGATISPTSTTGTTPAAGGTTSPTPAVTTGPALSQQQYDAQVAKQLKALQADYVTKCWKPALAKEPEPATSEYEFNVSFGPDGKETGRGISELRGKSRADVANCLRTQPMGMSISPAPGAMVVVVQTMRFP